MKKLLLLSLLLVFASGCKKKEERDTSVKNCDVDCGENKDAQPSPSPINLNAFSCFNDEKSNVPSAGFYLLQTTPNLAAGAGIPYDTKEINFKFSTEIDPASLATMTAAVENSTFILCSYTQDETGPEFCQEEEIISASLSEDKSSVKLSLANRSLMPDKKYRLRISPILHSAFGGIFGCVDDIVFTTAALSDGDGDDIMDYVYEIIGPKELYFEWEPPKERENGQMLRIEEVGGYELRYRKVGDTHFTAKVIEGSYKDQGALQLPSAGTYQFEIAAYDTNGLYSEFVPISPQ